VGSIPIRLRHFLKIMAESNKTTTRLFITILLLAAGAVLLSAGMFQAVEVQNLPPKDTSKTQAAYQPILHLSESTVILDVTIGGLVRLDSGDIQRTYSGDIKPAARCPT
jgi:hypothetical protein